MLEEVKNPCGPKTGEGMTSETRLEEMMRIAQDTKKRFSYSKSTGTWTWYSDPEEAIDCCYEPFATFLAALEDAVEPYIDPKEES